MKKKTFIALFIIFVLLLISTFSFANNDIKNDVHSATDTVIDGASNLANEARKGVGSIENTIEDGVKDIGNAMYDNDSMEYTTTRTSTGPATTDNMNGALWTWVILAVAGIVIVGLVWYYASQNNHVDKM